MGQTRLILIGAGVLLSLGMGIRQSLGLFLTPVTRDLGLTASDFTLAVAVQNIVWGVSQAPIGAIADRFGLRITMMAGAAVYVFGLGIMAAAGGTAALLVSGGFIGLALSCTASSLAMTAWARAVSDERRSKMLGIVAAAGSLGTLLVPLTTQTPRAPTLADRRSVLCVARGRNAAGRVLGRRGRPVARQQRGEDHDAADARSSGAPSAVSCHVRRVFRLRPQPGLSHHAFADLSGDLRAGSDAECRSH